MRRKKKKNSSSKFQELEFQANNRKGKERRREGYSFHLEHSEERRRHRSERRGQGHGGEEEYRNLGQLSRLPQREHCLLRSLLLPVDCRGVLPFLLLSVVCYGKPSVSMVLFISAPRVCETYTGRWKQTINIRRRASNSINKVN